MARPFSKLIFLLEGSLFLVLQPIVVYLFITLNDAYRIIYKCSMSSRVFYPIMFQKKTFTKKWGTVNLKFHRTYKIEHALVLYSAELISGRKMYANMHTLNL